VLLTGCNEVASQQSVSGPPTVEVAQPTKRIVTDWDEFTGRFEAVEEVQVRARVGGFVTSVEFRDGTFVNAGDLLRRARRIRAGGQQDQLIAPQRLA